MCVCVCEERVFAPAQPPEGCQKKDTPPCVGSFRLPELVCTWAQTTMRAMAAAGVECNTRTYNTLISAFERAGKVELAMDTFWEMQVHIHISAP